MHNNCAQVTSLTNQSDKCRLHIYVTSVVRLMTWCQTIAYSATQFGIFRLCGPGNTGAHDKCNERINVMWHNTHKRNNTLLNVPLRVLRVQLFRLVFINIFDLLQTIYFLIYAAAEALNAPQIFVLDRVWKTTQTFALYSTFLLKMCLFRENQFLQPCFANFILRTLFP